jgi:hypothetical protein
MNGSEKDHCETRSWVNNGERNIVEFDRTQSIRNAQSGANPFAVLPLQRPRRIVQLALSTTIKGNKRREKSVQNEIATAHPINCGGNMVVVVMVMHAYTASILFVIEESGHSYAR